MKRILLALVGLIVLAGAFCGLIYKFGGLEQYIQFQKYFKALDGEGETEYVRNTIFNGPEEKYIGGLIAWIGKSGVLLWRSNFSLGYYSYANNIKFKTHNNCRKISKNYSVDRYDALGEWKKNSDPKSGQHVFLRMTNDNKIISLNFNSLIKPWYYPTYFCLDYDD